MPARLRVCTVLRFKSTNPLKIGNIFVEKKSWCLIICFVAIARVVAFVEILPADHVNELGYQCGQNSKQTYGYPGKDCKTYSIVNIG